MSRVDGVLVAGIDLSGRTTGTTALAWLAGTASQERPVLDRPVVAGGLRGAGGDQRIVSLLVDARPDVVAIDAPLRLPHAVICRDEGCGRCFPLSSAYPSYTTRLLERKERWDPPMTRPMPMVMVAAIAFRGIFLKRLLEREDIRVIETWPAGAFRRIQGVDEPASSRLDAATRARLVLKCVDDPGQQLQQQGLPLDVLDAVAAALAAWGDATGRSHRVEVDGWLDEGSIVLPQVAAS
jgi:predicted nuclease with RNAse H fold